MTQTQERPIAGALDDQLTARLLHQRIIVLGQEVDDPIANRICAELLLLAAEDPHRDISLYVNSPGGSVTAGMAIYDVTQLIPNDVATLGMGLAASMGQFLLTAGTPGKRFVLPNSRIMIHQPLGGFQGQATDIDIHAKEILKTRDRMNELMAKHTGQPIDKIKFDTECDYFLSADESKAYGLIDEVLVKKKDTEAKK